MIARGIQIYKESFGGLSRENWWLALIMLVNRSGTMVVPFMTIYLTSPRMGYSLWQAGLVMGFLGVGAIMGGYLGGKATDRFGFQLVQLVALAGGGLLFIWLGQVTGFRAICMLSFLLSLVNESFRPANATAVAHYSNEQNRTRCYSLNRLAVNLGWAVGAALGGFIASFHFSLLFWVDGITNMLAAILLFRLLGLQINPTTKIVNPQALPAMSAYKDRVYLVFTVLTILFGFCFFQIFSTLTAFYKLEIGFTSFFIGMLMAINGLLITFIEMFLVYNLEGRHRSTYYIVWGVFLCAVAYLLLNIFPVNRGMAALMILVMTVGEILSMPFMNAFWAGRSRAENRGQYAGLFTIAWSIAHTSGPMVGSMFAQQYGFRALWYGISTLCLLTSAGFLFLHRRTR